MLFGTQQVPTVQRHGTDVILTEIKLFCTYASCVPLWSSNTSRTCITWKMDLCYYTH